MTSESRPLYVELVFPVKTYDVDFAGIVSNIVYIRWLEDLRMKILETYYPLEQALKMGLAPTLLRTRIEYLRPLRMLDTAVGGMWVAELGRARGVLQAEFRLGGEVRATAEQVYCFIDLRRLRAAPQPEALRRLFAGAARGQERQEQ